MEQLTLQFQQENIMGLRRISNDAIKEAALQNSPLLAKTAVTAYTLHKLLTKEHVVESHFWLDEKRTLAQTLEKAKLQLNKGKLKGFEHELNSIAWNLRRVDEKLGSYVQSVYDKARVKYAADAYYYGISLAQAASLLDVPRDDLQGYIGVTRQHDIEVDSKGIIGRMELLKKVLE